MKPVFSRLALALILALMTLGWSPAKKSVGSLIAPSNIFLADTLLYVSDSVSGVNIYSLSDASHPRFILNIPVKGSRGLAVRDSFLYVDSYQSILAIKRYQDTLFKVSKVIAGSNYYLGFEGDDVIYQGGLGCQCQGPGVREMAAAPDGSSMGGGGSYAVFALIDKYLYYVSQNGSLVTLNVEDPENPMELNSLYVGWNIETLFPAGDLLFVGGSLGMFVYSRSDPAHPSYLGSFSHAQACDPVVVEDSSAFVTLRSGNACGQTKDELLSLNIGSPENIGLLQSLAVSPPFGLAIRDSLLYVAFGTKGYGLYNVKNPSDIKLVHSFAQTAKDFIWSGNLLLVMGFGNVSLMDVTQPESPVLIATID